MTKQLGLFGLPPSTYVGVILGLRSSIEHGSDPPAGDALMISSEPKFIKAIWDHFSVYHSDGGLVRSIYPFRVLKG